MADKKTSALAILKILEENSDSEHKLTQPEILEKLENFYDVNIDRRTLYDNVRMLQDFGYDISTRTDNGEGYFLNDRTLEPSEVTLLCNAIHSSNFIPSKSSKELINKLLETQSKYFKSNYNDKVYIDNKDKKDNKEFFLNIDLISEAITNFKQISFNYTQYNLNKELVNRREELYELSPYYLVYMNEKTYLIGKDNSHSDLSHYRVDRMKNISFTDKKYLKRNKDEDPYQYAKSKIYMYHGEDIRVALKCDNQILDDIIDIFGKDITIDKSDDQHFIAYVKSSKQGIIYLALQYLNYMEVLDPEDIRAEIKQAIDNAKKKYK